MLIIMVILGQSLYINVTKRVVWFIIFEKKKCEGRGSNSRKLKATTPSR